MSSIFRAIAPAELDPIYQRGYNYQVSRAEALRQAADDLQVPNAHLLAAAERAEQSAREITAEQEVLAAYAKGDQVQIGVTEETRSNGVKITGLSPIAVGLRQNSHSLTAAGFTPAHKNPALVEEAFWETAKQAEIKTVQLPDNLLARVASNAAAFIAKALLGINFKPGVIETVNMPSINVIEATAKANQQIANQPITAHLERVAAANLNLVPVTVDEEVSEITDRANNLAAMAERKEAFETATRSEAQSAATTVTRDGGTIITTVDFGAM